MRNGDDENVESHNGQTLVTCTCHGRGSCTACALEAATQEACRHLGRVLRTDRLGVHRCEECGGIFTSQEMVDRGLWPCLPAVERKRA